MTSINRGFPIVYSCSGCSNVAQLANRLAVFLDRNGLAEMSCIAGVGAGVPSLVRTAQSGRPILAIDGCPLACCRRALANQGACFDEYLDLSTFGFKKRLREDCDDSDFEACMANVVHPALARLVGKSPKE